VSVDRLLELAAPVVERHRLRRNPTSVELRRLWSAVVLARHVDTLHSILVGRPVLAHRLDAVVLRRALCGAPLPDRDSWFRVRPGHLDAVAEAGPLPARGAR
jgi:hypothetical protein